MSTGQQTDQREPNYTLWLRSGQWLPEQLVDPSLEVKFNPYHDPRNGQFTFAPGGTVANADMAARPKRPQRKQGDQGWTGGFSGGGGGKGGGAGASGRWTGRAFPGGGGGSFGGAGATATTP